MRYLLPPDMSKLRRTCFEAIAGNEMQRRITVQDAIQQYGDGEIYYLRYSNINECLVSFSKTLGYKSYRFPACETEDGDE